MNNNSPEKIKITDKLKNPKALAATALIGTIAAGGAFLGVIQHRDDSNVEKLNAKNHPTTTLLAKIPQVPGGGPPDHVEAPKPGPSTPEKWTSTQTVKKVPETTSTTNPEKKSPIAEAYANRVANPEVGMNFTVLTGQETHLYVAKQAIARAAPGRGEKQIAGINAQVNEGTVFQDEKGLKWLDFKYDPSDIPNTAQGYNVAIALTPENAKYITEIDPGKEGSRPLDLNHLTLTTETVAQVTDGYAFDAQGHPIASGEVGR